jgi:hypothetical protein
VRREQIAALNARRRRDLQIFESVTQKGALPHLRFSGFLCGCVDAWTRGRVDAVDRCD